MHKTRRKLYSACVTIVMLYGSETWSLKESVMTELFELTCKWYDRCAMSVLELQNRLGIANITDVLCQTKLRWFGHGERLDKENPVNVGLLRLSVRGKGRPSKTWTIFNIMNKESWDCSQVWHKIGWPGKKPPEKLHLTHASMQSVVKSK